MAMMELNQAIYKLAKAQKLLIRTVKARDYAMENEEYAGDPDLDKADNLNTEVLEVVRPEGE